ncbi:MAG: Pyrrolo-quinoline quinone [Pedosphaera sp.]|nr:Pyrrolo-quinoline quinone [Pedosphaera sp.]
MTSPPRILPSLTVLVCLTATCAPATDWPHWRGPQDNGVADAGTYPVKWSDTENLLWKTPLPGKGSSTPIVWRERIYLTAPANGEDAALAFDWSGKLLWQTKLGTERAGKHPNGSGSNASPITDGESVFVYFKSGNFAALELDGKIRWQTNLVQAFGKDTLYWDHGASPVLTEKFVVMVRMHHGESWLAAFDKTTGAMRWKVARNFDTLVEGDHGYSSPRVVRDHGQEALLLWGGEHLTAHSAADGKLLWTCGGFSADAKANWPTVASVAVAGDIAVVPFGRSDRGFPFLYGIKLGGEGDVTKTHIAWKRTDTGTFVPSPAVNAGRVYLLRDRGEVECLDPATGKTIWADALPKASANFYSSPVIAAGKLYAIREDGAVFVAKVEDKFELLAENAMGERVVASPVLIANRIFIRGEKNLYCLGEK